MSESPHDSTCAYPPEGVLPQGILGPDAVEEHHTIVDCGETFSRSGEPARNFAPGPPHEKQQPIRLNLGAGDTQIDGFTPIDRKFGTEVYPLPYPDDSVDEIRASHVLEHFSHRQTAEVVRHWVAKLKPGGLLRVAVPNFQWIAEKYLAGEPIDSQGYTMGGHIDTNDRHGCIFDEESLRELLYACGLERIQGWASEIRDAAALDVSLNLQGRKRTVARRPEGIVAVMSVPRFGPTNHYHFSYSALQALGIPLTQGTGVYWQQVLTGQIEDAIEQVHAPYLLTIDYDTIFRADEVRELWSLMETFTEYDAIIPVQSKRGEEYALFALADSHGEPKTECSNYAFQASVVPVLTGHFGLTIFRSAAFAKMKRPWFMSTPDGNGQWREGCIDADIGFWKNFRDSGLKIGLATRVVVGHLHEMIIWPNRRMQHTYQMVSAYDKFGRPADCWS